MNKPSSYSRLIIILQILIYLQTKTYSCIVWLNYLSASVDLPYE